MTDEIGSIACHFCKGKGRLRERDIHGEYNWEICGCVDDYDNGDNYDPVDELIDNTGAIG